MLLTRQVFEVFESFSKIIIVHCSTTTPPTITSTYEFAGKGGQVPTVVLPETTKPTQHTRVLVVGESV
jgi:hypothetical protein